MDARMAIMTKTILRESIEDNTGGTLRFLRKCIMGLSKNARKIESTSGRVIVCAIFKNAKMRKKAIMPKYIVPECCFLINIVITEWWVHLFTIYNSYTRDAIKIENTGAVSCSVLFSLLDNPNVYKVHLSQFVLIH